MIKIIGHKSPDTDSTGSPIIWAWYKKAICGVQAQPKLLGEPNPEARFVLDYWQFEKPEIISQVFDNTFENDSGDIQANAFFRKQFNAGLYISANRPAQ